MRFNSAFKELRE